MAERAAPAGIVDASIFASRTRLAGGPLLFEEYLDFRAGKIDAAVIRKADRLVPDSGSFC